MKRALFYLIILSALLVPCLLTAGDISVIGNIPTTRLIDSIALSPNTGMAYGIDKQNRRLYIIDLNTYSVTKTVFLSRRPIGIAVNPSNNLAYVTLKAYGFFHKKGSLCTVDSNGTILNTLAINGDSHGIAVNPENNTIVLALEREKKLLVLSADTLQTLQEIQLPYKPRLVALDTDSGRAVVTAGVGLYSWWQHIVMIVDINTGSVLNTITLKRGVKGVAVDTGKDIAVTTGLKEINLFDISSAILLSNIKDGDDFLNGIKLKALTDNSDDDENSNDNDINTNITSFLSHFNPYNFEIDEAIIGDLKYAGNGLSAFQNDSTYGLDINQSTHIAVISGEESLLLLDLNTNALDEYPLDDISRLMSVAVDKYRNISLVSYLKNKRGHQPERGVLEVQLPNPVPEITGISPSGATVGDPGCALRVEGDRFITSSSIKFNQFDLDTTFSDNNTLDAIIPSTLFSSAGIFPVTVTNPLPAGGESNGFSFLILNPVPSIVILDPSQALAGTQGLDINISGTGFTNNTVIYINDIERSFTRISSIEIILSLIPADLATGGYIEIKAFNPEPGGGMSNSAEFAVLNPAPALASITPNTVTAASPGFTLELTGSNFLSTTTAYFNNSPASTTFISSSRIDITIPSSEIITHGIYTVKVLNSAPGGGESNTINLTVTQASTVKPLPEGSYGKQYEDLIPSDATIDSYDPKRFSIITGLIKDRTQNSLSGVTVSIKDHPEYGTKQTDTVGSFSIPAEGGGFITVIYKKAGFITSHRQVEVGWNDIANVEDVVMIPEDTLSTAVVLDGNPDTIITHKSSVTTDEFGSRSLTMVFEGDNRAFVKDENGDEVEITSFTTRATEFDTPESMPAKLRIYLLFGTYCRWCKKYKV